MEEKKELNTNISTSTFLLVLAVIAIIVMGLVIYKLNNDKIAENQKSAKLQEQMNSLSVTVSDLQNKIDNISKIINSNNQNTTSQSISEEETNDANKIIRSKSAFGFAGASNIRIVLYANGDTYLIYYDGSGYEKENINEKKLIAKNVEVLEDDGDTGDVILKGKNAKEIELPEWVKIQK